MSLFIPFFVFLLFVAVLSWYLTRKEKLSTSDDYYLNGLKTLDEPVKIVDPEWNDWLEENQYLVGPMGLRNINSIDHHHYQNHYTFL